MIKKLMNKIQNSSSDELFLKELLNNRFNESNIKEIYGKGGVNINRLNSKSENYLFLTLFNGNINSAIWLLENGIEIDVANKDGITPFNIAVENQHHKIVKIILSKIDQNLNIKDMHGRTLLQNSIMLGDHEMAKILIEHTADLNSKDNKGQNILHDALSYGHIEFIDYLLTLKKLDLNNVDNENNNILHHNFSLNNDEIALKFINHGVNPNLRNNDGDTYLSKIAQRGVESFNIIEVAIKNGFDINSRVANKKTILMEVLSALSNTDSADEAKRHSLLMMSQKLIEVGIDINAVNDENESVLFQTIKASDLNSTLMLIEKKININIQNNYGETPFFYACYGGIEKLAITIALLKYGADPTIKNNKNQTILEILNNLVLSNHGKMEFIDNDIMKYAVGHTRFMNVIKAIFKYYKRELNFLDSTGDPIFFKPLLHDNIPLFKLYLKAGVDFKTLNNDGNNLFFEYVLHTFQNDNEDVDFETGLSMLISAKVNHNAQDKTGWTVVSKIVAQTPCNKKLFKALLKRVRFDYKIVDKLGRSILHSAVWSNNIEVIKLINPIDSDIKNIPDHYGILPSIYAALIGNKNLLLYLIEIKAKLKTDKTISQAAIKKFSPLLKNLEKLKSETINTHEMNMIFSVEQHLRKDFIIKV
jgi:ankyrin repeat protein